ncbi:hypothetical protein JIQ42_02642 [Leishmania sp. Namibia]|uniref:hypothetical protein n=1 Tax=Leishmania sp. Namibia TaxID=2802991 RepID=UPI001B686154|nr:hypothetical protein JIQ42_02642 [Leishmania sp. Namibia]
MGKIEVTVCAARNLHSQQLVDLPDPFVRVGLGEKKYKTRVAKNSLNPEWNETFRFEVADEMSAQVRLEVWSKCTYSDDLMGYYNLSLGGLTKGIVKDKWYILEKSKTEAELRVRVLAVDFGATPKPEEQWMVTEDIRRDPAKRALEDGTWRPGQKTAPLPSGPPHLQQQQLYALPAPAPQQLQAQQVQPQPEALGIQYVAAPPPSGPPHLQQQQLYALPAPAPQQLQAQQVQPQPEALGIQYVAAPPQQVPYVLQPQVQYLQQPQAPYITQQQPVIYVPQQPPQGYYQPCPPPQPLGYYPACPPPPLQNGYYQQAPLLSHQGYYAQPPPQGYAPQPPY